MTPTPDRLYELLPVIYRQRDAEQNYPLRDFLRVLSEQVNLVEADIAQLYENWFIETAQDWAVPYIGDLIQKSAVARFTRTLSTLLSSGVSIMEALEIASKVTGNHVIENALLRAREAISEGKSLTVPLAKEKYIPQMVTQMIGVGEQTGAIDQMLNKVADFYEDEVDVAVAALTSVMEPLLMVFLGGIVAVMVIAMYLPIFNMAGSVK